MKVLSREAGHGKSYYWADTGWKCPEEEKVVDTDGWWPHEVSSLPTPENL